MIKNVILFHTILLFLAGHGLLDFHNQDAMKIKMQTPKIKMLKNENKYILKFSFYMYVFLEQ